MPSDTIAGSDVIDKSSPLTFYRSVYTCYRHHFPQGTKNRIFHVCESVFSRDGMREYAGWLERRAANCETLHQIRVEKIYIFLYRRVATDEIVYTIAEQISPSGCENYASKSINLAELFFRELLRRDPSQQDSPTGLRIARTCLCYIALLLRTAARKKCNEAP